MSDNNCNSPGPQIPAPTPPYARPLYSPFVQTLFDDSVPLQLVPAVVYLSAANPGLSLALTLPPGNYQTQFIRIYVPTSVIPNSATWTISGTFAGGFTKLVFSSKAWSAVLEWDGSGWQMIGGNAQQTA